MSTVTVQEIKIQLAPGEHYAGVLLADDGEVSHHLVLLPGELAAVKWRDAIDWAIEIGGELPTRREQSLLFANLKSQFEDAWYWSANAYEGDGDCAWDQYFSDGFQSGSHKSYGGRARAVRRVTA